MPKKSSIGMFGVVGTASVIGLHMVSGIVVGGFIGWFIDKTFDTKPLWTLIFGAMGVIAGFMNMWRDVKRLMREQDDYDKQQD